MCRLTFLKNMYTFCMKIYTSIPDSLMPKNVVAYVFDKDGTITKPNRSMDKPMATLLAELNRNHSVAILTARDMEVCRKDILAPIENEA